MRSALAARTHSRLRLPSVAGTHNRLDLDGTLYVGGLGSDYDRVKVPPQVWSGTRRIGYVGCMRDLVINGSVIGLATYARRQDSGEWRLIS